MDVKESKEALVAVVLFVKEISKAAKDGLDLSDAVALGSKFVTDAEFREKLVKGVQGIDKLPAELKDIAASEALELLGALYEQLKAE